MTSPPEDRADVLVDVNVLESFLELTLRILLLLELQQRWPVATVWGSPDLVDTLPVETQQ